MRFSYLILFHLIWPSHDWKANQIMSISCSKSSLGFLMPVEEHTNNKFFPMSWLILFPCSVMHLFMLRQLKLSSGFKAQLKSFSSLKIPQNTQMKSAHFYILRAIHFCFTFGPYPIPLLIMVLNVHAYLSP